MNAEVDKHDNNEEVHEAKNKQTITQTNKNTTHITKNDEQNKTTHDEGVEK